MRRRLADRESGAFHFTGSLKSSSCNCKDPCYLMSVSHHSLGWAQVITAHALLSSQAPWPRESLRLLLPHERYWHQGHNLGFGQLNANIMLQIILQYWPAVKQSCDLDDRRNGIMSEL